MRDYLIDSKIPPRIIFTDYAGFDTFDSIFRAKEIFGAQELIIVSQEFHLPRALFLADSLDIDAIGLSANLRQYAGATSMQLREIPANIKAFANVIFNSQPKFLGEKIPIEGDGRESWDNNPLEPTETSNP
jgi:SanA protein